jgi:YrbI family 3-deoxy-D-manno-octulosonate 8-phosphate phosphatase
MNDLKHLLKEIRMLVCDFDGVFTNNKVYSDENGREMVRCDRSDSLGIALLKKNRPDIQISVISKEKNPVVVARCKKLGISCYSGVDDKLSYLNSFLDDQDISITDVAYIGNDWNDRECIRAAGIGIVVADSHHSVLPLADIVTSKNGGDGAIREIIDIILE